MEWEDNEGHFAEFSMFESFHKQEVTSFQVFPKKWEEDSPGICKGEAFGRSDILSM